MRAIDIKRTVFRVSDFLTWQRTDSLELSPYFQRRPVWRPKEKSFFIDTVLRGLPAPVIYVREKLNLTQQTTTREIVNGQQRLRTLFSFIDSSLLGDYKAERDHFTVERVHNSEIAGKSFLDLADEYKTRILEYEFSTHILPSSVEDREVLTIFARLNSTGVRLTYQELRNARFFGIFKTLMYELALEQLERWRRWRVFSENQIAKMTEVETTSDLVMTMMDGVTGKTQKRLDKIYGQYDERLSTGKEIARRFRKTMDVIDELMGKELQGTVFSGEAFFYSLFVFCYEKMYRIGSPLDGTNPRAIPARTRECLRSISSNIRKENVPEHVLDSVRRASSDTGRRRTRHEYMMAECS